MSHPSKVIAWLWARTVKSPNPAFSHVAVPLITSYVLSSKTSGAIFVDPIVEGDTYRFEIKEGNPPAAANAGTTAGKRNAFLCLLSGVPIDYNYIRSEGKAGRIGQKLMAVVVEGNRGRIYVAPTKAIEEVAAKAVPEWIPDTKLPENPRDFKTPSYGLETFGDLFTPRQLVALNTFSNLIQEARSVVLKDAISNGWANDGIGLNQGGVGATAYADAVAVYMAFSVDKASDYWSSICTWHSSKELIRNTFGRQAIPMTWDYAETNPFSDSAGNISSGIEWAKKAIEHFPSLPPGFATQADAQTQSISAGKVVSTDPPYYDNIGYAELSDFFYIWLRRSLRSVFPDLFTTMAVPKAEELVATPYRHGSKSKAEAFFLTGMTLAMRMLVKQTHPAFPTTIYYAFKQSDTTDVGTGNTGWETFLEAVLSAGFAITGTWPMRTELANRMISSGTNALASSIVLVCRIRTEEALTVSRRDFLRELKDELAAAVDAMIGGSEGVSPVAPVDLAQAVIGPGMAIFSKYAAVLEADGSRMTVHTALMLINRMLTEGSDDFDADTQFCLGWFDEQGWSAGEFGKADVLARAKGTSVDHVREAGVVESASARGVATRGDFQQGGSEPRY